MVAKFLQSIAKDKETDYKKFYEEYKDFIYKFADDLDSDYSKENNYKTSIRGLKVRGTYSTQDEAKNRANKLQRRDASFNVFVGQVGHWLPWDPCADKVADEVFLNDELNNLVEKYKEESINRDILYADDKQQALEENQRKIKEKEEQEKEEQEKEESFHDDFKINSDNFGIMDSDSPWDEKMSNKLDNIINDNIPDVSASDVSASDVRELNTT